MEVLSLAVLLASKHEVTAVDIRDGKTYTIAKFQTKYYDESTHSEATAYDIWMTQNLDLDIEAGRTYTSADTDLANSTIGTSWTPTVSTSTTPEIILA